MNSPVFTFVEDPPAHTTTGVRFNYINTDTDLAVPGPLVPLWLLVDGLSAKACVRDSATAHMRENSPYADFWKAVDTAIGKTATFTFIGELDPRQDLCLRGHRLSRVLSEIGVDVTAPIAHSYTAGVSLHYVPRWPGYYLLLRGAVADSAGPPLAAYVFRLVS